MEEDGAIIPVSAAIAEAPEAIPEEKGNDDNDEAESWHSLDDEEPLEDQCLELQAIPGECWISEPTLWISDWVHLGILISNDSSELMTLDANAFAQVIWRFPSEYEKVSKYARKYVAWLSALDH